MNVNYAFLMVFLVLTLFIAGCPNQFMTPQTNSSTTEPSTNQYAPPFIGENNSVPTKEFAINLLHSQEVYLVEDLRDLSGYPLSKNNIMQCAVDYAGSRGLAGKTIKIFAFDTDEICQTPDGQKSTSDCYALIKEATNNPNITIIWVEKGDTSKFYSRALLVQVNESYSERLCNIDYTKPKIASPDIVKNPSKTKSKTMNISKATQTQSDGDNRSNASHSKGYQHTFP